MAKLILNNPIQIPPSLFRNGIATDPPAVLRIDMQLVVVNEAQLVVHVFTREEEFVLSSHVAFRRNQPSIRTVFVQGATASCYSEDGGDVFQRVVHVVEMFLHLRPVHLPARHCQYARSHRFHRVPDVTALKC